MYYFLFDRMQLPIPPKELRITVKNKNKTAQTIGLGEINIIKPAGLTDISFEILLPNSEYPFNQSIFRKVYRANYYLAKLEALKTKGKPFQFIIVRMKPGGEMLHSTNMRVVLEDYKIKESHDAGFDSIVTITLKQYKEVKTKKIQVSKNASGELIGTVDGGARETKPKAQSFKSNGGSILKQAKRATGGSVDVFSIAKANKLAVPFAVAVGEVVDLAK